MPATGPSRAQVKIQKEAAEYREYMVGVYMQRGIEKEQALALAAVATDTQLAIRIQELERLREKQMKERQKLQGNKPVPLS